MGTGELGPAEHPPPSTLTVQLVLVKALFYLDQFLQKFCLQNSLYCWTVEVPRATGHPCLRSPAFSLRTPSIQPVIRDRPPPTCKTPPKDHLEAIIPARGADLETAGLVLMFPH